MGLGSEASLALVHVQVISTALCGPGAIRQSIRGKWTRTVCHSTLITSAQAYGKQAGPLFSS